MRPLIPILLVLVASPALAQDQDPPTGSEDQEATNQDPPAVSAGEIEETIAMVRDALDMCREARVKGDLDEARLHLGGALEVLQELSGLHDPKLLGSLEEIDDETVSLGILSVQLISREWIVEIRERLLPADHSDLLDAKQRLAGTRHALGDLAGAHQIFERVHAALERLLPADDTDLLAAKNNLAIARRALGDLEGARALREHVHAAWERLLPPDDTRLLAAKQNLAITLKDLGDFAGALELEEHVHTARERLLPADHFDLLAAKENLALTRRALGDREGACELAEHVHAARERLLPPDHPHLLAAKQNLANARWNLGDLAGAHELWEHVHTARERLLPADDPDLLAAKGNLAFTHKALGNLAGALALEEHVHTAWERLLPPDHPRLLTAKQGLAVTRKAIGDLEGARAMTRSLLAGQRTRTANLSDESPRVARSTALVELHRFSEALFLSESTESDSGSSLDDLLFSVLESLRLVSTSSSEVALAAARYPELAGLRSSVADARAGLNDLGTSPPDDRKALESWRKDLVKLAGDRDGLERKLRSALKAKGIITETITSEGVGKALKEGSLAVGFFRYPRHFEKDPDTGEAPPTVDSLLGFVSQPDGSVQRVELGAISELEVLATRWRALLGKPIERGVPVTDGDEQEQTEEEAGRALRERLLDPCLAVAGEALPPAIHLVLDDFLHLVPLDALPWTDERRVGEVISVHLEVSMRRLVAPTRLASGEGTLVAMGGVDFGAEEIEAPGLRIAVATPPVRGSGGAGAGSTGSENRGWAQDSFSPLLNSRYEVQLLGSQYVELVGGEPVVLVKAEATKKALVELAPKARFLHIATHGWFAPERFKSMRDSVEEKGVEQRGSRSTSISRAEMTVRGFAPETLCGLALAGANHGRNALGQVPGIITAEELATLELHHCELAVLSACETNVGLRRAGQGIQSLQGALHAAGVRTAITSLWKVDDAATRRLMELFYTKLWKDKLGKADALWQAKMALRAEGHPVRDWAAWVMTGDPD